MTLQQEVRSKSAQDLGNFKKCQHEFRRKTILSKSPMLARNKTRSNQRSTSVSAKHHSQHQVTKCHSLPRKYKQTVFNRRPKFQPSAQGARLEPQDFKRRLETIRGWLAEFSEAQLTALVSTVLPLLGAPQLHYLSSQLPEHNPGLHHLCPAGCSDPLFLLPAPVSLGILSLLSPTDLATASRVCSNWRDLALTPSLWQALCRRPEYRLTAEGSKAQLERWRDLELDWRQVFVERYKLRRAWMGGQCHVRTFEGHSGGISCVQFDGGRIVSGSHDKTIKVWNVKTNSPWSVITLAGHSGEVRCLHLDGNRLVSGSTDLTIKVWDLSISVNWSSIACRVTMVGHTDTVRCVQMDRTRDRVISGSYDTTLKLWELRTGICVKTLRGHTAPVLAIQAQGDRLVSGGGDKTIRVWQLDTGYCAAVLSGHNDAVTCLTLDSGAGDMQRIISGSLDRTIKVWSLASHDCLKTLDWMSNEGHTGVIRCLQADDWRILSAADDKMIKVWNLDTGQRLQTLKSHTDGVTCLQFNDFYIVSGSYDKTVKLWDFTVC